MGAEVMDVVESTTEIKITKKIKSKVSTKGNLVSYLTLTKLPFVQQKKHMVKFHPRPCWRLLFIDWN